MVSQAQACAPSCPDARAACCLRWEPTSGVENLSGPRAQCEARRSPREVHQRAGLAPLPYSRVNDPLDSPIYLIVADDGTACIAPAEDWTIAARGDFYPCPGT